MDACCCIHDCGVFDDNFDREDLGDNWSVRTIPVTGVWVITAGELTEAGNDGAIVICQVETATEEQSVSVELVDITNGLEPGIVCNYLNDDNYFFVELEHSGIEPSRSLEVRFYRRSGGVDTLLHSHLVPPLDADPVENRNVNVCFSRTSFSVSSSTWIAFWPDPDIYPGGRKAGLRNGSAAAITLDEFTLQNFTGEDSVADFDLCCVQQCHCIEDGKRFSISHNLILTLSFSGCLGNGSADIPLTWNPVQLHWESEVGLPAGIFDLDNRWVLKCDSSVCDGGPGGTFILTSDYDNNPNCDELLDICFSVDTPQTGFTCKPLIIEFDGTVWPDDKDNHDPCGLCGEVQDMSIAGGWSATVTEA